MTTIAGTNVWIMHAEEAAHPIRGGEGALNLTSDIRMLKVREGVTLGQIRKVTDGNNLDEIVLRDEAGRYHVVYADELNGSVEIGDRIVAGGVEGEVVAVDDEWNEEAVGVALIAVPAALSIAGFGVGAALLGTSASGAAGIANGFLGLAGMMAGVGGALGTVATGIGEGIATLNGAFEESDEALRAIAEPEPTAMQLKAPPTVGVRLRKA